MTMAQAKRFLTSETKRWAHVIAKRENVRVKFVKSLGRYAGVCWRNHVEYCLISIQANLDNREGLTNLAIHEVIHFKIPGHGNDFQTEYRKWTGKLEDHVTNLKNPGHLKPVSRGKGKTLIGKYRVDFYTEERVSSARSPTGCAIRQTKEKTKPLSKSQACKVFDTAKSKGLLAFLYEYQYCAGAGCGWKQIECSR